MRYWIGVLALAGALAPTGAQAQTLPEALAQAYQANPTLEAQRAATRQTDESYAQAMASFLPQVNVTGSVSRRTVETESSFGGLTNRTRSTTEPNSYGVQASQSLFEGGRRMALLASADAQIDAAQAGLRSTEQQVLLAVIAAFMDVRRDEEQLSIRNANVALLEEQLKAARERFQVGVITRTDVAQAEARLAGAKAGLAGAVADLEASKAAYQRIIGQPPGDLSAPPAVAGLPASLDDALNVALDANPDLQRARNAERVARESVKIEESELWPSLALVGRYDRTFDQAGAGVNQDITTAAAQLNVPLFEGGFARSRTRAAKIGVTRAQAQVEEARRAITAQVVQAWNDYQASLRVIDASRQQASANTLALEGVTLESEIGERTTLDVLNARQELLEAQLAVVRAERDSYLAAHALLAAIGRLDAKTLGLNVEIIDPQRHREAARWRVLSTVPAPRN